MSKEVRAGKAFVEIALRDNLQAGLKQAASQLRAFAATTAAIGAGLTGAGAAILGPLAAAVHQFSSVGDSVEKMATRTGMTAEAVSELAHAADLSGTDVETIEAGLRKMQRTLGEAALGSKSAKGALAGLGLSVDSLAAMSPDQQLAAVADRLAAIQDPALRTAAAMDIFGKSGTQLLPMLADGAAGIEAMRQQARDLGLTITTDMASSSARLNDALGTMWSTIKAVSLNLGATLAPLVTDLANRVSVAAGRVIAFIRTNQGLVTIGALAAVGMVTVGTALTALAGMFYAASVGVGILTGALGVSGAVILFLPRVFTRVATGVQGTVRWMLRSGNQLQSGLTKSFGWIGQTLATWQSRAASHSAAIRAALTSIPSVAPLFTVLGQRLLQGAQVGITALRSLAAAPRGVASAFGVVQGAAAAFVRGYTGNLALFTTNTNAAFNAAGRTARSFIDRLLQVSRALASGNGSAALQMLATDARRAGGAIRSVFEQIPQVATSAWNAAKAIGTRATASLATFTTSTMRRAFALVQQAGTTAFRGIRAAGMSAMSSVASGIRSTASKMAGGLGAITSAVAFFAPGAGGMFGSLLVGLPIVTSAIGGIATVLFSLLSPIGLVAAATTGLVVAWTVWSKDGAAAVAGVRQVLTTLWTVGKQVFGGIADAMAAGDLQLAARVLWAGLKAAWYTGLAELSGVWPQIVAPAVTAWNTIASAAASVTSYLGNLWAQLPQWLAGPLGSVGESVGAVVGWIGDRFGELVGYVARDLSAIGSAIASGDWSLAAEIAWTAIRLAFASGIAWVTAAWSEFTTGLAAGWDYAITAIRTLWNNVSSWIARQILNLVGAIQSALEALDRIDPSGLAGKLRASLDVNVAGALTTLEEDRARLSQGLDAARQQRDSERAAVLQKQLADTEARLAELRAQREATLAKSSQDTASDTREPGLAQARAELDQALAAAAQARGVFDAAAANQQVGGRQPNLRSFPLSHAASLSGTFSAAVAGMLGRSGDDPAERTAEAVESMDEKMSEIRDELRDRPTLAFGN